LWGLAPGLGRYGAIRAGGVAWRRDVEQLPADVIDLQRRVVDVEARVQHRLHLTARSVAVAVAGDEHVRGERREAARDLPHVQVVNLDHVRLLHERFADRLRVEPLGRRLQEDAACGRHQPDAGADHQRRDHQRDDRVGPLKAGQQDEPCSHRRADERVQIGDDVLEAALHVEALAVGLRERAGRGEVYEDAENRHDQHQRPADRGGMNQPHDGLIRDEGGEDQQRDAVRLGREDLRTLEAECHRASRGTGGKAQRDQRKSERAGVGEHVSGVGQQRERVRDHAGCDLDAHERDDQREREGQPAAVGLRAYAGGVSDVGVGHRLTIAPASVVARARLARPAADTQ
jgi:hypothetical protein